MPDEYEKGQEIGELRSDIKNLSKLLEDHIKEQHKWNENMENEVELLKAWVQTTSGKVIILTTLFGIVGSLAYIAINWFLGRIK